MANADPILTALARMEDRFAERVDQRFRELRFDLDGSFDGVYQRLDRLASAPLSKHTGRSPGAGSGDSS